MSATTIDLPLLAQWLAAEADPADAPPDCLVCGADAPCADCAAARDWWDGVQLPELYESVHEMALRHSYSR